MPSAKRASWGLYLLKTGLQEEAGLAETGGLVQPQDRGLGLIAETETTERAQDLGQTTL